MKAFDDLIITDDFMFCRVMHDNPDLCRTLLATILNIPVGTISFADEQHAISITPDNKGVRFDVYLHDDKSTIYDIELQTAKTDNIPKRSRYYQSMIDWELLDHGVQYDRLNKSYIIFICNFDLFKKNDIVYTFEERCVNHPELALGDDKYKVFVNLKGDTSMVSPELKAIIDYMAGRDETSNIALSFSDAINRIKTCTKWRREYMTLEEMITKERAEGVQEGIEQGIEQGTIKTLVRLVSLGLLSVHDAADQAGVSVEDFEKLINKL